MCGVWMAAGLWGCLRLRRCFNPQCTARIKTKPHSNLFTADSATSAPAPTLACTLCTNITRLVWSWLPTDFFSAWNSPPDTFLFIGWVPVFPLLSLVAFVQEWNHLKNTSTLVTSSGIEMIYAFWSFYFFFKKSACMNLSFLWKAGSVGSWERAVVAHVSHASEASKRSFFILKISPHFHRPALFNTTAINHRWLLSIWNMANLTVKLNFSFILIHLNINFKTAIPFHYWKTFT